MSRLLVTGGAGFIGANFVHYWCRNYPDAAVVVLDALTYAGNRSSLQSLEATDRIQFVQGSISDSALVESILHDHEINTVVHFAAESHVDRSIVDPDAFIETNVVGTHTLLKVCRKLWLDEGRSPRHRFHHISTDEVYGSLGASDPAFKESTPYAPNSPYAASKAGSDHLARAYHCTYGLDVTMTNCSNNYGPFQFPEKLVPLAIVNILQGRPLPIYGDGRNVREWLFVHDHCRAIETVLARGLPGHCYNVGGGCEIENLALIRKLCRIADTLFDADRDLARRFPDCPAASGVKTDTLIKHVADRPGHDRRYAINGGKLEKELGYRAQVSLDRGLRATIQWYLDNERWWLAVMDGSYRDWITTRYGETLA